jgi:hypothetical protein
LLLLLLLLAWVLLAWVEALGHALSSQKLGVLTDYVVEGVSSHDLCIGRHVHLLHGIALVPVP